MRKMQCVQPMYWKERLYRVGQVYDFPDDLELPVSKVLGPFFVLVEQAPPIPPKPTALGLDDIPGVKVKAKAKKE